MSNETNTPAPLVQERSLALINVGELPRPTPKAAPGPIPAPQGDVDAKGVAFDPSRHERRTKADGSWCLKRGNGARRNAGLPNAGRLFQQAKPAPSPAPSPAPAPATAPVDAAAPSPAPAAAPAPEFAPGSRLGSLPPDDGGIVPDVEENPTLNEADYQPTGEALSRGFFAFAQLALDREPWEPAPGEQKALAGALTRVWHHYTLPRIGPLAELLLVLLPIFAKRSDAPKTRRAFGWFADLFRRRDPQPAAPQPAKEPEPTPTPAPPRTVAGAGQNPNPPSRFRMVGG